MFQVFWLKGFHQKDVLQSSVISADNPKVIVFFTAIFHTFKYYFNIGIHKFYAICNVWSKLASIFSKAILGEYIMRIIGGTFIGRKLVLQQLTDKNKTI